MGDTVIPLCWMGVCGVRLREPRVSKIIDDETGSVLVKTTWDNSHDVGGQNYEFTFCDEAGLSHSLEVRTQDLLKAHTAYREKNPHIKGFAKPGYDEFKEEYYKNNPIEHQVLWFVDRPKVDDVTYQRAARVFCEMFLRLEFSYEFNREDDDPVKQGFYSGKINFYSSPSPRLPSFQMEVGGDD